VVGTIEARPGIWLRRKGKLEQLRSAGYEHFR
jgi:hypothetical protein